MSDNQKDAHKAAGSYQREIEDDVAGQQMGRKAPPETKREGSLGEKEGDDTTGTNPKRTENSEDE